MMHRYQEMVYYPDPLLRRKAESVAQITPELLSFVQQMRHLLKEQNGAGLAAPQVGKSLRLFLMADLNDQGEELSDQLKLFINPILSDPSSQTEARKEGCLSIPGITGTVERPWEITVEALDEEGKLFKTRFTGLKARIAMHENDHLNGVLFVDRLQGREKKLVLEKLKNFKRHGRHD